MHVTIGLRLSRTRHRWLQRMHGRTLPASPAATLAPRSGSAICALVISTMRIEPPASSASAMAGSTMDPWATTAVTSPTVEATRRASSELKPAGTWESGVVASEE